MAVSVSMSQLNTRNSHLTSQTEGIRNKFDRISSCIELKFFLTLWKIVSGGCKEAKKGWRG